MQLSFKYTNRLAFLIYIFFSYGCSSFYFDPSSQNAESNSSHSKLVDTSDKVTINGSVFQLLRPYQAASGDICSNAIELKNTSDNHKKALICRSDESGEWRIIPDVMTSFERQSENSLNDE